MKKMSFVFCILFAAATAFSAGKYGTAVTHGGRAKISFYVVDDEGKPIGDAMVRAAFYFDPKKQSLILGETDTNGLCSVEGITQMDISRNGVSPIIH